MPAPGETVRVRRRLSEIVLGLLRHHRLFVLQQIIKEEHRVGWQTIETDRGGVGRIDELGIHGDGKERNLIKIAERRFWETRARTVKETVSLVERRARGGKCVAGSRLHRQIVA